MSLGDLITTLSQCITRLEISKLKKFKYFEFFRVEFFLVWPLNSNSTRKFYLKLKLFWVFSIFFKLFQVEFDNKCSIKTWKSSKIGWYTWTFLIKTRTYLTQLEFSSLNSNSNSIKLKFSCLNSKLKLDWTQNFELKRRIGLNDIF